MKNKDIRFLLIIISTLFISTASSQEAGHYFLKNYTHLETDFHSQTWATIESDYGKIYFGANTGIIEYDGNKWKHIETPSKTVVRCFKKDTTGRIYVGAAHEFGYLDQTENKIVKYHSLTHLLDSIDRVFNDIWDIAINDNRIYFKTSKGVIIYNIKKDTAIYIITTSSTEFITISKKPYILNFKKGIAPLKGDSIIYDNKYSSFNDKYFYINIPFSKTRTLFLDYKKGFIIYNSLNNSFQPWYNNIPKDISNDIFGGIILDGNYFLFRTTKYGAIIVNKKGRIISKINKKHGLKENQILNAYFDSNHNIWLNLNNGMAHVEYAQPFTILDENYGITGYPYFSFINKNTLYTATTTGLFKINIDDNKLNNDSKYEKTSLSNETMFSHFQSGDTLLISSSRTIYAKEGAEFKKIFNKLVWNFSKFKHNIIASTLEGFLKIQRNNNKWQVDRIKGLNIELKSCFAEEPNTIWATQELNGVYKLTLNNEHDSIIKIEIINKGLQSKANTYIHPYNNTFVVSSKNKIYSFDKATSSFIPVEKINKFLGEGSIDYFSQETPNKDYFWFWLSNNKKFHGGMLRYEYGGTNFDTITFQKLKRHEVFDVDVYNNKIFITSEDGVIIYKPEKRIKKGEFKSFISEIKTYNEDSTLFGSFTKWDKAPHIFSYKENGLSFHFGTNYYQNKINLEYKYKLEGLNSEWSKWTHNTQIKFNSLQYGEYTFHLKSKNILGDISQEATFPFIIKTPWYYTRYAIIALFLLIILMIYGYIRYKAYNLKQKNILLEEKVEERTQELLIRQKELKKEKEKTEELNTTKDKFFSIIAHDLRNPFNSLLGLSEILHEDYDDLEENEKIDIIKNIVKSSRYTFDLLENLLTWSRTQRSNIVSNPEQNNIYSLIDDNIKLLRNNIDKKNITVHNDINRNTTAYFDKNMIVTVIRNLLSNAIKFTDNNGVIEISEHTKGDKIYISIKDNGIGMNSKYLSNIFKPDKQTQRKGTANESGTGLGLLICNDFIKQNGGEITVKSELGKGSEFIFSLKRKKEE